MIKAKTSRSISKSKNNQLASIKKNTKKNESARASSKSNDKIKKNEQLNFSKNVEIFNKLINNSHQIVQQQDVLLEKYTELSKKINKDGLLSKEENEEFFSFLDKYSLNLNNILSKLKNHSKDTLKLKEIEEENKILKEKLKILEKEKLSDNFKTYIIDELNDFNYYLLDQEIEQIFHKINQTNFDKECFAVYFQNLKKLIKNLKLKITDKDNQLGLLKYEKDDLIKKFIPIDTNKNDEIAYFRNVANHYEKMIENHQIENNKPIDTYSCVSTEKNIKSKYSPLISDENSSFENFRRNKEMRLNTNTSENDLFKKYSDTYFYKNEI